MLGRFANKHTSQAIFKSLKSNGLIKRCNSKINVANFLRHSSSLSASEISSMYQKSLSDPEEFWGDHALKNLSWIKEFSNVTNSDLTKGKHEWFTGGKLNVSGSYLINGLVILLENQNAYMLFIIAFYSSFWPVKPLKKSMREGIYLVLKNLIDYARYVSLITVFN